MTLEKHIGLLCHNYINVLTLCMRIYMHGIKYSITLIYIKVLSHCWWVGFVGRVSFLTIPSLLSPSVFCSFYNSRVLGYILLVKIYLLFCNLFCIDWSFYSSLVSSPVLIHFVSHYNVKRNRFLCTNRSLGTNISLWKNRALWTKESHQLKWSFGTYRPLRSK